MTIKPETLQALKQVFAKSPNPPIFLSPCSNSKTEQAEYEQSRQVFNRKFDFQPAMIVKVKDTSQVASVVRFANHNNMPITVRSGGHDHEGESVATGKVLLDFSLMNSVELKTELLNWQGKYIRQLTVQPGARFEVIKPVLDDNQLAIAHGTCQTVAIAGYTLGGGWGPWTRKHGMGCERLTGATLVLGDGTIRYLGTAAHYHNANYNSAESQANDRLLWALRGGGGLSYGIVTEFYFEPFERPSFAISFHIDRTTLPVLSHIAATHIIAGWEALIKPKENPQLIGTNLKVDAIGVQSKSEIKDDAVLDWRFNGHFAGTLVQLKNMLIEWLNTINGLTGKNQSAKKLSESLNDHFDKICSDKNIYRFDAQKNNNVYPFTFDSWDRASHNLALEGDCPAPHKITSKMPTDKWTETDRKQLVCSLQSPLLYEAAAKSNITAYITLGAINGSYYGDPQRLLQSQQNNAFPYADRAFTIQYQAWWDQPSGNECSLDPETANKLIPTRFFENRAQDWIQSCRNHEITNTNGSFISFKDASVPTFSYFESRYQPLIEVKLEHSKDDKNLLRSRKTIL